MSVLFVQKSITKIWRQRMTENCRQKPSLLWMADWDHGRWLVTKTTS